MADFNITLIIEEFSPPSDQQGRMEAFQQKGNEVSPAPWTKCTVRTHVDYGHLGYDVSYVRQWKEPDGSTKYRLVTNRPITFGEAWAIAARWTTAYRPVELVIFPDKRKTPAPYYLWFSSN
jgi:hypothetical protein